MSAKNLINKPKKQPKNTLDFLSYLLKFLKIKNNDQNIAVLRLQGVISSSSSKISNNISLDSLKDSIDEAFSVKNLKAVILQINCPGGSPAQSELIYKYIRMKYDEKKVPLISFVEDVAASGGLYLAYASDEVYALETSIVGSIGVRSSGFGFQEAMKKLGIERRIYTQGENKVILDPFLPEKESDIKIINKIQKNIHESFKNFILERRKNKLNESDDYIFSGEFWSGRDSLNIGLVDEIGDMYEVIKRKFGENVNIKKIDSEKSWIRRKFGISSFIEFLIDKIILSIQTKSYFNKFGL